MFSISLVKSAASPLSFSLPYMNVGASGDKSDMKTGSLLHEEQACVQRKPIEESGQQKSWWWEPNNEPENQKITQELLSHTLGWNVVCSLNFDRIDCHAINQKVWIAFWSSSWTLRTKFFLLYDVLRHYIESTNHVRCMFPFYSTL